jgi:pseudouridine-5'-phosphate glycosidase/pseudouridine kinase
MSASVVWWAPICTSVTGLDEPFANKNRTGTAALEAMKAEGLDTIGILTLPEARTAQYIAINDHRKDLILAMADMNIISQVTPDPSWIHTNSETAKWAVVDGNWNATEMQKIVSCLKYQNTDIKASFEPVSVPKAANLFKPSTHHKPTHVFPQNLVDLSTPNIYELTSMYMAAKENGYFESQEWWEVIDSFGIPSTGARDRFQQITNKKMTDEGIPLQTIQLLPFVPTLLTKLGADGVLLTQILPPNDPRLRDPDDARYILSRNISGSETVGGVYMRLFPAIERVEDVVSVNGVGDTFLGVLVAGLAKGKKLDEGLINAAQKGAVLTLRSKEAVSLTLGSLAGELDALAG